MPETFLDGRVTLHCGDSRDVLRTLPDASIHSVVCDPPYALVSIGKRFSRPGAAPAQHGTDGLYARASAGFMGQAWDTGETAFAAEFWGEVLRVLKPGGHVVAFGGTRTYHRLACAIEDAGFELRDTLLELASLDPVVGAFVRSLDDAQLSAFLRLMDLLGFEGLLAWVYGSGFPKSHDVAKGIQKRRTEDHEPIRVVCREIRAAMDAKGLKSSHLAEQFGGCHPRLIDHWAARDTDSQPELPSWSQWLTLKGVLGLGDGLDAEVWRLNQRKGAPGEAWTEADILAEHDGEPGGFGGHRFRVADRSIRAVSDLASSWEGWGTALKPAWEPIVLARKPLSGTVAEIVLAHGTGALNIDACRIEGEPWASSGASVGGAGLHAYGDGLNNAGRSGAHGLGRWPANVVHDGSLEVVQAFPETSSGAGAIKRASAEGYQGNALGRESRAPGTPMVCHGDTGSAARFFYSAKADADDRLGSKHPTVKPVDLMQWLCRLVTPPGGVVLDPFAGTGTTGEAAWREGFSAVLIEREAAYQADIRRRMALCLAGPAERKREAAKARASAANDAGPLFSSAAQG